MKKFFAFFSAVLFAGSMMATSLLEIDFTQTQGEWTIDDKELGGLEYVWQQHEQYGMKATAYVNGNHAAESWLISPAIDLSAVEKATLVFSHARRYGDLSQLSVKATEDGQNWADLTVSAWPDGTSWDYVDASADLTAFVGKAAVKVAFVYTSTETSGATWEIKSVAVTDEDAPDVPQDDADVIFGMEDFAGQGVSGSGGEVTATKNGVTFFCDKGYGDGQYGVRCYKGSTVTITSETEQIAKIVFEFGVVSGDKKDGGLDDEIVVNGMEWSATLEVAQARMNKIKIYFGSAEEKPLETISVTEAMEIGEAFEGSGKTTEKYAVRGFVISAKEYGDKYEGKQTFYMSDDPSVERGEFTAYNCAVDAPGVVAGEEVIVIGFIQKYVYDSGDYVIEITGGEVRRPEGVENIMLTEKAQKVVVDGVVYIVRDNKLFNLQGAQVR